MKYTIVIKPKLSVFNTKLVEEINMVCRKAKVKNLFVYKIYSFCGEITLNKLTQIVKTLLTDTIVEDFVIYSKSEKIKTDNVTTVNIWYKPEVLDVEALYVSKAIKYIGFNKPFEVHSGKQIRIQPAVTTDQVKIIVEKIFANPLIQYYEVV